MKKIRIKEFTSSKKSPLFLGVDYNDTRISVAVEEYKLLKTEILKHNDNKNSSITYGITAIGALTAGGYGLFTVSSFNLSYFVCAIILPVTCMWVLRSWLSYTLIISELGKYLQEREKLISSWIYEDVNISGKKNSEAIYWESKNRVDKIILAENRHVNSLTFFSFIFLSISFLVFAIAEITPRINIIGFQNDYLNKVNDRLYYIVINLLNFCLDRIYLASYFTLFLIMVLAIVWKYTILNKIESNYGRQSCLDAITDWLADWFLRQI